MPDPNNYVLHRSRAVFMLPCKCAQTTVTAELLNSICDTFKMKTLAAPLDRLDLYVPTCSRNDALLLKRRGYRVYGTVRDPFERLISCYRDKFSGTVWLKMRRRYDLPESMRFKDFINFVGKTSDHKADQHFRSMAYDLVADSGEIIPDILFNVSKPEWWDSFADTIAHEINLNLTRKPRVRRSTGPRKITSEWYNTKLSDVVYSRYKQDFKLLR